MRARPRHHRLACTALLRGVALLWPLWALLPGPAQAESLRCEGGIASEGDSRLALVNKCGPPVLADSYCAPVEILPPRGFSRNYPEYLPCQPTDEWLYDRGPGNLQATVRLRAGRVISIHYGETPR
jgi:hypothetical protein